MQTIGKLAKSHGLSRSTLLYYDRIGLLKPGGHTKGEYRLYTQDDEKRLERICTYRKAGVSLGRIADILDAKPNDIRDVLEARLVELNHDIQSLHQQQAFIARLLGRSASAPVEAVLTKESWVGLLRQAGFSDDQMKQWHISFEREAPERHEAFLTRLGIDREEIKRIRLWSKPRSERR
jgi:DNA-binding transcriptional MerR regulator